MFSGAKRHRLARSCGRDPDQSDQAADETIRRPRQQRGWRESAQRVTRSWHAWLAADRPERGWRYRAYEAALAGEEKAAAQVEHMLRPAAAYSKPSQRTAEA
jgi:hypothetical protein